MENKRYRGKRHVSARNAIAVAFVLIGAFFVFGGVGAIEKETVSLGVGLVESFGGAAMLLLGMAIGKVL